jgi:molybdopterin molybdotransferase
MGGMRSVDEHRRIVADLLPRTDPVEMPMAEALGRVLAADIIATIDLPPFANSAMDGYAVRAADVATLPVELPVSRDIPAGARDVGPLAGGTAARIMTGAPVPDGADLVVPVEQTDGGVHRVRIEKAAPSITHIRPAGDDVRAGSLVLPAGTVINAAQVGAAAALGYARLPVYRPVTVLVLSTGSELAEPGTELAPGQIYESNGSMLAAAVSQAGAIARPVHFVIDDVDEFRTAIDEARTGVDLVVTSGGVSAGAYEVVKDALTGAGVQFCKVAMQPGMPQGAGTVDGLPFVTLPGNPVSSYVSFEVFVRPAIRSAMGFTSPERPVVRVPLSQPLASPAGKRQFRRATLDAVAGTVAPIGGPGSHLLGALAGADSLLVVPEDVERLDVGDVVDVWLLEG